MRILFVGYSHTSIAAGGAQQVAAEMMRVALKRGHDATMIVGLEARDARLLPDDGALSRAPFDPRVSLFAPRFYDPELISCGDARATATLREHIRRLRPDVVHFHHYHRVGAEALVSARLAAPAAKLSLTFHEMVAICPANGQMTKVPSGRICSAASPEACAECAPSRSPGYYAMRAERLRAAFRYCDHLVFPSRSLAATYQAWGVPTASCAVIPNGLALARERRPPSPDLNRFAFFGQMIDNKGLDVALSALLHIAETGRVPPSGLEFQVHGANRQFASAGYLERLEDLAGEVQARSGQRIRIVDRGEYRHADVGRRMAEVDWVVVPSVWNEVFGLVVSEAWTYGRPVIASAVGGLAERISPGRNGLTFPPGDAIALANHILAVTGDAATWRRLSDGIEPPPDAEQMFDAYERLWRHPGAALR